MKNSKIRSGVSSFLLAAASTAALTAAAPCAFASPFDFSPKKDINEKMSPVRDNVEAVSMNRNNTLILRGEVDAQTVSTAITQLMTMKASEVYLFISSPGGSVMDGIQLIQAIMSSSKRVHCVIDVAASMAAAISQACDSRFALRSSIFMQHVATLGLAPQQEPNALSYMQFIRKVLADLDAAQAKRAGMDVKEFEKKIRDDLWLFGDQIIKSKFADKIIDISCSVDLTEHTIYQEVQTMFGTIKLEWSGCPLVSYPKSISFPYSMAEAEKACFSNTFDFKNELLQRQKKTVILAEAGGISKQCLPSSAIPASPTLPAYGPYR